MTETKMDPISFEILRNALDSITEQMNLTVKRTGRSAITREVEDCTSAIADADGRIIAVSMGIFIHMGHIADSLPYVLDAFKGDFSPGDVIICNDPYYGGTHLPDIIMTRPVFLPGGPLIGFSSISVHHVDVGGRFPGSMSTKSTEIFQEGLRIPPVKLYEAGRPNHAVHRLLELNVRLPSYLFGDLAGQAAGCMIAEREYLKLLDRYGLVTLRKYRQEMAEYSERVARQAIASLPEGTYEFVDHLDDDGVSADSQPLQIGVRLAIHGDSMTIDLTNTSPQAKSAINAHGSAVRAPTMLAVRTALQADVPLNSGLEACVRLVTRPGTLVHPLFPAPVASRSLSAHRIFDAVLGALAQAVPERIPAAGSGGHTNMSFGGYRSDGRSFVMSDSTGHTYGARPMKDGFGGTAPLMSIIADNPVEVLESTQPVRIEQYGFVPDTAGPGKFRGGPATVRDRRFLEREGVLFVRTDRRRFRPWGLAGGQPGSPSWNVLNPGPGEEVLPTKGERPVKENDLVRQVNAGGGGYGNPYERDPEAVRRDYRDGLVTAEGARRDYGVVLQAGGSVDGEATERLRGRAAPQR